MEKLIINTINICMVSMLLLLAPALAFAQPAPGSATAPPIAQQLVREGDFALRLESALGLEKSADEAGAESRLGQVGIIPRNGWIADYPVTPDIMGELQKSVGAAADAGKIPLNRDEALRRFAEVAAEQSLPAGRQAVAQTNETLPEEALDYPDPAAINDYYADEGPPVVTYYAPPPDYYYLYSWVPYQFWCYNFWFPGFFILHDFHRSVFFGNRFVFVSNHFNDINAQRVFRVDPVARFNGRTFAGIGVTNRRGFISTGVPGSASRIFNGPHTWGGPGGRTFTAPPRGGTWASQSFHGNRSVPHSVSGGRSNAQSFHGGRSMAPSSQGGRTMAPSARGGGISGHSSHGGGFHGGGGRR